MDPSADADRLDQIYRLLALCARAEGHPALYDALQTRLEAFTAWEHLPDEAERHGMSALLWHHLRQSGLIIPSEAEHILAVLYLRQRALNRLHTQALLHTCALLEDRGIRPLLLKGLALAYQYYPEPALRTVSDLDLLLAASEMAPAVEALLAAGYTVQELEGDLSASPPPAEIRLLAPAVSGTRTPVELHHGQVGRLPLYGPMRDAELAGLYAAPQSLEISGRQVLVPAPAAAFDYLLRHFQRHLFEASSGRPLPLKWVADILSIVERHAAEPAWSERLRHDKPLRERLQVLYSLTPLPAHLAQLFQVHADPPPAGVNRYPGGWPRDTYRRRSQEGLLHFILQTWAVPSAWWLRLHYGISQRACWWYGAVVHPLFVLGLMARGLARRLRRGAWQLLRSAPGPA